MKRLVTRTRICLEALWRIPIVLSVCICFDLFSSLQVLWFCMKLNIVFQPPGMSRINIKLLEITSVPLALFIFNSPLKRATHIWGFDWNLKHCIKSLIAFLIISLSLSLSNFLPIPSSLYLNPLLLFCLFCLYIPSTCLCPFRRHGWWLRHGHRGHRRHPYCCLFPAAGGRGCHLLFPQQVRAPHVHCC